MSKEIQEIEEFTPEEIEDLTEKCINFTELLCAREFYPYQIELAKSICRDLLGNLGNILTGLFSRQSGKDLDIETPILTSSGWKTMGSVEVGDKVYSEEGTLTNVVATSPLFTDHKCYELVFSDGTSLVAGEDHKWKAQENREWKTVTTKEIAENPYIPNSRGYLESRFRVEGKTCIDTGPSIEVPIDPYILGYWLGDGHANDNVLTVGEKDRKHLEKKLIEADYFIQSVDKARAPTVGLRFNDKDKSCRSKLRSLKVLKNKHIPDKYLTSSIEQRKQLLAGLLDSDGFIGKHKQPTARVEYSTVLPTLAQHVHELARSLGEKPTIVTTQGQYGGKKCRLVYRVCWTPKFNPFFLERKRSKWSAPVSDRQSWLQIRYVQEVPTRHTRCIQVDHPSHVFLVGRTFIPTHNSETVANVAGSLMVILPKLANIKKEDDTYLYPQLRKFRSGLWVGIFTPSTNQSATTYKRLRDRVTTRTGREILETPELALEHSESLWPPVSNKGDYLELNNGSYCLMMSADKQSKIESKTFHLLLLDESQDLDEFIVGKSIMPMGAATNATTVATGTPSTTKGYFYNTIEFNKTEQLNRKRIDRHILPQLHFEYNYKTVQKYNSNYKKYVAKERKKLGYDSDEFKMAYRLIWMFERGMALDKELFDELTIKSKNIVSHYKEGELVAGLDWGKESDSTILTIGKPDWENIDESGRCAVEVLNWWEKVGDNYEVIFPEVKAQLAEYSVRTLSCDATGVGEPLFDRLTFELPYITVIPVKFSPQQKDHLYKFFLLMLQQRMVTWPGDSRVRNRNYFKKFEQQMLNLQKEYKGQFLSCHAPTDQRNAHDDYPDSLALMLWCINEEAQPFIEVSDGRDIYIGNNWRGSPHPVKQGFSLR